QIRSLPEDGVVVILPAMFTGHTDMVQTPFGIMPGGFIMSSLVNSTVTGDWLTVSRWQNILPCLFAFIGTFFAINLSAVPFIASLFGGMLLITFAGLGSFAYFGLVVPWLFSL